MNRAEDGDKNGGRLRLRCETCGFVNTDGQKFCNNCGSKLKFSVKTEKTQNTGNLYFYDEKRYETKQANYAPYEKNRYERAPEAYGAYERRRARMAQAQKIRAQRNLEKSRNISRLLNAALIVLALIFAGNTLCITAKKTRVDTYEKIFSRAEDGVAQE